MKKVDLFSWRRSPHNKQGMILVFDGQTGSQDRAALEFGYDRAPHGIHHGMRCIGVAGDDLLIECRHPWHSENRSPSKGARRVDIAMSRMEIEDGRLLVLKAASCMMDTAGNKAAGAEIAMIEVVVPKMALHVLDRAIQAHGGAGVSQDTLLAAAWAHLRTLRLADGG